MSTTVDPTKHEVQYTYTFTRQWDDYWLNRPEIQKPSPAEQLAMLKRCIQVRPDEVGFQTWNDRLTFYHPDMDGQILFAVLEGVTQHKPNGQLVFLGLSKWRAGRRRHPDDVPPKFLPPGDDWAEREKVNFAERKAEECRLWIEVNGPKHPNYRDVKRTHEQYLRLLDRLERDGPPPSHRSAMEELEDVRAEVKRYRTGH